MWDQKERVQLTPRLLTSVLIPIPYLSFLSLNAKMYPKLNYWITALMNLHFLKFTFLKKKKKKILT